MTTATNNLSAAVQQLIDARLDNIERVLMASGTSCLERQEIIASVEDQIMELIARKGDGELERDQMLQILASLDPPEAYLLGDDKEPKQPPVPIDRPNVSRANHLFPVARTPYYRLAIASLSTAAVSSLFIFQAYSIYSDRLLVASLALTIVAFVMGLVVLLNCNPKEKPDRTWMAVAGICAPLSITFVLILVRVFELAN